MTTRQKLDLPVNQPTEITLLFDEPISGKSQYGTYNMYAVAVGDNEFSYFPCQEVSDQLKLLRKNDRVVITRLAAQRGSKIVTTFDVKPLTKEIKEAKEELENGARDILDSNDEPAHDSYFNIMRQSLIDGLEISRELNGMADPEKIAVTLFIARSKQSHY